MKPHCTLHVLTDLAAILLTADFAGYCDAQALAA